MHQPQYTYRAQKDIGLVDGPPLYAPQDGFQKPEGFARTSQYSPDGRLFAYALVNCVRVVLLETHQLLVELPVAALEIGFSPRGTFLSTLERYVKNEDGTQNKNLRVWNAETGTELASFSQRASDRWDIQYTPNEAYAVRLSGDIQVFNPRKDEPWDSTPATKLRIENCISVSLSPNSGNPHVAAFVPERKGAPAIIRVLPLLTLSTGTHTAQKTFFKSDRVQVKWNANGTMLLCMTQTDVDKSNKSYYGETGIFLISAAGNYDARVILDKEGPIHDFTWNPSSKEFAICYGFMPAKTTIFDQRCHPIIEFPPQPHNFVSFNPQGRLVALAGFGNLQGKVDVYDRRLMDVQSGGLRRIGGMEAGNTTHFEWSPDGRLILTAILSPRLRVDNGVRLWHCAGTLLEVRSIEDLYQAQWRPLPPQDVPPFPQAIPPVPQLAESAVATPEKIAVKPAGAYRPPGARGQAASSVYKREDENGSGPSTPIPTPPHRGSYHGRGGGRDSPGPSTNGHGGYGGRGRGGTRHVPGAPPPQQAPGVGPESGEKATRRKKGREKKKGVKDGAEGGPDAEGEEPANGLTTVGVNEASSSVPATNIAAPEPTAAEGGLDPVQKKIRNLTKKLKAIEELKEKAKSGAKLETTQYKKIETEGEIRKELAAAVAGAGGAA